MKTALTFDIDWVDDWVLQETIDILLAHKIRATFFATHESNLLRKLSKQDFEIALHPNYDLSDGVYKEAAFRELAGLYPEACGVRSHTLLFGSRFIEEYESYGIRYESNCFLYMHQNLECVQRGSTLKSVPFNWSDDKHIELKKKFTLSTLPLLNSQGLNVFNFHPIHVYLNTNNLGQYQSSKVDFNSKDLNNHRHNGEGVRTLLIKLCEEINRLALSSSTMKEIASNDKCV